MPGIPDPPKPVEPEPESECDSESEETNGSESESEVESEREEMSVDGGDSDESVFGMINGGDLSSEDGILRIGEELLQGKEEWEKLRLESLEIYLKQLQLRKAQTKLVLDALKAKGNGGQ